MTDLKPQQSDSDQAGPLSHLHKMSTTAGLGTTEYVAINPLAVTSIFLGLASALALLDNTLLALPIATVICAIFALRQIVRSGGTQTGKALAILGLLLALGFSGVVLGRSVVQQMRTRADTNEIDQLVSQVSKDIAAGKNQDAFGRFSPRFTARVTPEEFAGRWDSMKKYNKLKAFASNGRLVFHYDPESGQSLATGMVVTEFDGAPSDRLELVYRKSASGPWAIDAIPLLFPDQQQQPPGGARQAGPPK